MKEQKLIIISVLFLILFNFPMLSIFNNGDSINGIPMLYLYVFFVWILFIVIIFNVLRKERKEKQRDE
jgi:archaellum biogenesis protein FlaJ (TadC family)